jgi:hypothetical protein
MFVALRACLLPSATDKPNNGVNKSSACHVENDEGFVEAFDLSTFAFLAAFPAFFAAFFTAFFSILNFLLSLDIWWLPKMAQRHEAFLSLARKRPPAMSD